jgi:hypothetical protein
VIGLVEHAGKPFRAASIRTAVRWFGDREGDTLVGSTTVLWRYAHPDAVAVSHDGPVSFLTALMGVVAKPQSYSLRVLRDATPSGGSRWWWGCPGCGRRCGLLYLVAGRPRLACRTCLGLTYLSQTLPRKRRGARR